MFLKVYSVLGPILFLIYINDIYMSSQILNFHLFADDTSLFYSHENIDTIEAIIRGVPWNFIGGVDCEKKGHHLSKSKKKNPAGIYFSAPLGKVFWGLKFRWKYDKSPSDKNPQN